VSALQTPGRRTGSDRDQLAEARGALRAQLGLVLVLLAAAAAAWWSTASRMAGMDAGPGTDLGTFGWFLGVWVVMMAAMMLPALAPTAALFARMSKRLGQTSGVLFASGYLFVWGAAGAVAYGLFSLGRTTSGSDLAWRSGGRWLAGAVIALAALYELTPLKAACLARCRSPLASLLGSWREGPRGAVSMGMRHAGWCLGCCSGLMAALFALGVMSLTWMVLVAALILVEKTLPWRLLARWGTAALLIALSVGVVVVPRDVPGLVVPHGGAMQAMKAMR